MTKTLGIGYTIFEFDGETKKPVAMVKAKNGNFEQAMREAYKKAKSIHNKKLFSMCVWMGAYGFTFRVLLALLQ